MGETSIWEAAFLYLVSNRHRVGTVESTDSVEHDAQRWSAFVVRRVPTILRVAVSTGLRVSSPSNFDRSLDATPRTDSEPRALLRKISRLRLLRRLRKSTLIVNINAWGHLDEF